MKEESGKPLDYAQSGYDRISRTEIFTGTMKTQLLCPYVNVLFS